MPAVKIGDYEYQVVPQRIGRLKKRLGPAIGDLTDLSGEDLGQFIGASLERAHAILQVFIPDLMPVYEFAGYKSKAAYESQDDDDDGEYGPTIPELVAGFQVAFEVNKIDAVKHLKGLVDPTVLRAWVTTELANRVMTDSPTTDSASSSSTPGQESASTTSGMNGATLELSGV